MRYQMLIPVIKSGTIKKQSYFFNNKPKTENIGIKLW